MEEIKIQTIDEIVEQLLAIKAKHGNLQVTEVLFANASYHYQKNTLFAIKPCIITNPDNEKEYLVIFD